MRRLKAVLGRIVPRRFLNYYHLLGAFLANVYYGFPSRKLTVVGVTGTDGKTTTANLIFSILKAAGKEVGLVTSINAVIGESSHDTGFHVTSPNPFDLQRFLRKMVVEGCRYAVLEVTSHALDQHRTFGIGFEVAAVTNVTREHLDYHKTYENYLKAKSRLLAGAKTAILNADDESFDFFSQRLLGGGLTYSRKGDADVSARRLGSVGAGSIFTLFTKGAAIAGGPDKPVEAAAVRLNLPGAYNVSNALAAAAACLALGINLGEVKKGLENLKPLPGRFEEIDEGQNFRVVVDFAHTPNALEQVLRLSARLKAPGAKLLVVFGCAGLRDRGKRPLMGEIAAKLADGVILTAEDPRTEDVDKIIEQMAVGCRRGGAEEVVKAGVTGRGFKAGGRTVFFRIPDRSAAIDFALQELAREGDWVLVTGKGHEKSMCFGETEYPWSDQEAVRKALRALESKRRKETGAAAEDFVKIGNLQVFYTVAGAGAAVILLHGWGGSRRSLSGLQRRLAEGGFKVYALDLPGFGRTPAPSRVWNLGDYAELVRSFAKVHNVEEFFLFGHSFGGRVAVKLAAFKTDGLKKLILCGVPVVRGRKVKRFIFLAAAKVVGYALRLPGLSLARERLRFLAYRLAGERDYYRAEGSMRETFKNIVGENLRPSLKKIGTPTLVLWGRDDRITPLGNARILESEIENARLEAVENAGHGLPLREPQKVGELVAAFLKEKRSFG